MPLRDTILPEFEHEMNNTRRTLERVAESTFGWRPHDKSFTMLELASHLANVPAWTEPTLRQDSFDFAPKGGESFTTPQATSTAHLLEMFDANIASSKQAIAATTDDEFMANWSLLGGGEVIFSMPRIAVLRSFIMNHAIHHRAQLGVYLRLNDIAVPAIYGPSADEESM